jgi:hypothetical protein
MALCSTATNNAGDVRRRSHRLCRDKCRRCRRGRPPSWRELHRGRRCSALCRSLRRCRPRTLSSSHFENLIWPLPISGRRRADRGIGFFGWLLSITQRNDRRRIAAAVRRPLRGSGSAAIVCQHPRSSWRTAPERFTFRHRHGLSTHLDCPVQSDKLCSDAC